MAAALPIMAAAFDDASVSDLTAEFKEQPLRPDKSKTSIRSQHPFLTETLWAGNGARNWTFIEQTAVSRTSVGRRPRKRLPAWFRRVSILDIREHRNYRPEDFDVDISELGESDKSSEEEEKEEAKCECDSDASECDCGFADEDDNRDDDNTSEKDVRQYAL